MRAIINIILILLCFILYTISTEDFQKELDNQFFVVEKKQNRGEGKYVYFLKSYNGTGDYSQSVTQSENWANLHDTIRIGRDGAFHFFMSSKSKEVQQ
jgi:hypothetical protein